MKSKLIQWSAIIGTATILSGCMGQIMDMLLPVNAKVTVTQPPRDPDMVNAKRIAVTPFKENGREHDQATADVEAMLEGVMVEGSSYFQIIDRQTLDSIFTEYKLSDKYIDSNTAVQIGKLAGADTILSGKVSGPTVKVRSFTKKNKECVRMEAGAKPYEIDKCLQWVDRPVSCKEYNASVYLTPRAVNVESGRVIYTKKHFKEIKDDFCQGETKLPPSPEQMKQRVMDIILTEVMMDVAPTDKIVSIKLLRSDGGKIPPMTEEKLKGAIKWAKSNRMDRACNLFKEAMSEHPSSAALTYNVGVCAEIKRDLQRALVLYKEADSKLMKPNKTISEALERILMMIKQEEQNQRNSELRG